jgi:hypothetical protein
MCGYLALQFRFDLNKIEQTKVRSGINLIRNLKFFFYKRGVT